MLRSLPLLIFATVLGAQTDFELPRLRELGPLPAATPRLTLRADGTLWQGATRLIEGALAAAIPAKGVFVLAADHRARCGDIEQVLAAATARGATTVWIAAQLPDGSDGAFTLALPAVARPGTTVDLRLHRERDGVPPASVVPVLARMVRGAAATIPAFVVGIDVAADEQFGPVLQVLAATATAGVSGAVFRCAPADARAAAKDGLGVLADHVMKIGGDPATGLAIDLGPAPLVCISARVADALPAARQRQAVGLMVAPGAEAAAEQAGGAGGRYGGRGGAGKAGGRGAVAWKAIQGGLRWLGDRRHAAGGITGDDGEPDVEATALGLLAVLGDGASDAASHDLLRTGLGFLLDQQRPDGSFFAPGLGSVRRTALCTYALTEGAGLLRQGALLRGSVADALAWLGSQRQPDGGFTEGNPAAASDCSSTTLCMMAIASAGFFKLTGPATPQEVVAWYDLVVMPDGAHRPSPTTPKGAPPDATATAAALFARYFAGQKPDAAAAATVLLAHADVADPWCAYWTTYALFQTGGAAWQQWNQKLDTGIVGVQVTEGGDAGSWPAPAGLSRAAATALRVLALESYYRYSRLIR